MADAPTGLAIARPAFKVGGEDKAFLAASLLGLVVHETVAGLFRCEATFGNWGNKDGQATFLFFDRDVFEFGKDFTIKVGDATIFDGRIIALEAHFPEGRPAEIAWGPSARIPSTTRREARARNTSSVSRAL
jgi:hypothetical protein